MLIYLYDYYVVQYNNKLFPFADKCQKTTYYGV